MQSYNRTVAQGLNAALLGCLLLGLSGAHLYAEEICAAVPDQAISWWPAESSGVDVLGENHGQPQGDVRYVPGKVGLAIAVDGAGSLLLVPDSPSLDLPPGSEVTLEAWVLRTSLLSPLHIAGKRSSCGADFNFYQLAVGAGAIPGEALPVNRWTHVAITIDSAQTATHFVDGRVVSTGAGSVGTNTEPFRIGGSGSCTPFGGFIDELTLYGTALSASTIRSIYRAGEAGKCRAKIEGHVTGMKPKRVRCDNLTTGDSVSTSISESSWDCVGLGLKVTKGERVRTLVVGHVD